MIVFDNVGDDDEFDPEETMSEVKNILGVAPGEATNYNA